MSNASIRDAVPADIAEMSVLNEAAVPAVNSIDREDFEWFLEHASYMRVAETDGRIDGLLIALEPGTAYESTNYRWFCERYESFLYVDRIIVGDHARSGGFGAAFYQDLVAFCQGRVPRITCEVNIKPPNPGSMRFHLREGFEQVGEAPSAGGTKAVAMLARTLTD